MTSGSVKITIIPSGPAVIETEKAEITLPDGKVVVREGKFLLCRCGHPEQSPFCDGTHKKRGWCDMK